MAKGFHRVSIELQDKWYTKHRNSIDTDFYEPLWRVEDIKSKGVKAKVQHFKELNRATHLLSQNEVLMFMLIAWNPEISQSYEQYALPLSSTLAIADELNIKHPQYPTTKVPCLQTLDFFCLKPDGSTLGYAVKQEDELFKIRSVEKLAIQEAWCAINTVEFHLVDSSELKQNRVSNLERIYRQRNLPICFNDMFDAWLSNFWSTLSKDRHERLANIIEASAKITGLPYQQAVHFFHHGLWSRQIHFNWDMPIFMELPAQELEVEPYV